MPDTSASSTTQVDPTLPLPMTYPLTVITATMSYIPYTMRPMMTPQPGIFLVFPVLQSSLDCTED